MKYIYHHLGLGDHIICNGIIRHFVQLYNEVSVFCKPHYEKNVRYMFKDDERIKILSIGGDSDVNNYISSKNIINDVVFVGFGELYRQGAKTFDESFYKIVNLPFEQRFEKFKFLRNLEKEKEILNILNPSGEPYIYVHDDKERGFEIDRNKIKSNLKIIENDKRFLMFDMLGIIENAEEVHMMQTGMKDLINSFIFNKPKFYLHWYVRNYDDFLDSVGLNSFIKIF
jgi:hypothetical protein